VISAHFRYRKSGMRLFPVRGDPGGMNAQGTMPTATWLNLVMLFMNTAIWLDTATRIGG
jgi:hypothetical protein